MWGSFFLQYMGMDAPELAIEKAYLLNTIMAELEIRREMAGQPLTQAELKESSMLKPHEIIEGDRIFRNLKRQYQERLRQKGGVDGVIKELEDYIIALLGNDESYRTDELKRQFNPDDPLIIAQLKAALRAIKDNAPGSSFGSFLDPSATSQIGPTFDPNGGTSAREMLAYFWLAASDPQMELDAKDEPKREQCLREEKMMVVASLSDIRRAHNDDVDTPVKDVKDSPSCGPGTWGRIAKMHVHNNLTKMNIFQNNTVKYKGHMPAFVIDQFKGLSLASQLEIVNEMNNFFINRQKSPSNAPFATFESFIVNLQHDQDKAGNFLHLISQEYGNAYELGNQKFLDENHQRFALLTYHDELRKIANTINNDLFLRLQQIMIDNLTRKANEAARVQLEREPTVKQAKQRLNKIEIEITTLQQQLAFINESIKSIDFKKASSMQQVEKLKAQKVELDKRFMTIISEKNSLGSLIDKVARQLIAVNMRDIISTSMTVKVGQVDELLAIDVSERNEGATKPAEVSEVSTKGSGLAPEIEGIKPVSVLKHPSYTQIKNMYANTQKKSPEQAAKLAAERLLKMLIETTNENKPLTEDKIAELVQAWFNHYGKITTLEKLNADKNSKSKARDVSVKMSKDEKEIVAKVDALTEMQQIQYAKQQAGVDAKEKGVLFNLPVLDNFDLAIKRLNRIIKKSASVEMRNAALEAKRAIGISYYHAASALSQKQPFDATMYEEHLKKAELCGINTSIHLDPKIIRQEGIDKAIVNPAWLVRLKAKLEDIEERFRLNSAYVGKAINDTRYAYMIGQFNLFIEKSDLSELLSAEAHLTKARDAYFNELEKEAPLQSVLLKHYEHMQEAQKALRRQIDHLITAFGVTYKAKERQFYDTDRAFLLDLVSDSDEVERSIIPSMQEHFKIVNERLAQLSLLQQPHQLYQDTETAVKTDTTALIESFYQSLAQNIALLESRKPSKGTIAAKQLKVLTQALSDLKVHVDALREQIALNHLTGVPLGQYHQAARAAMTIANGLQAHTTKIGQASGVKKATRNVKNGLRSAFHTVGFNVDVKGKKELTTDELDGIQVGITPQTIDRQVFDIDYAKGITKDLNAKRQPLMSFAKKRREQQRSRLHLSVEQSKLAIDYILLHVDNPEEVNLLGLLKPGVSISLVDLKHDPVELLFEYASSTAPKRIKIAASQLSEFADAQRNKVAERDNLKYAAVYEKYSILLRDYHSFGHVGTEPGRAERREFVVKLYELLSNDPSFLPLVLKAQQTKGLLLLSESLENSKHLDLLAHVQGMVLEKAAEFRGVQPVGTRDEWESTTAASHRKELKDALDRLIDMSFIERPKI